MGDRFWRFYEKANDVVRTFTGPAQVGIGRPEGPPTHLPGSGVCLGV